LDNWRIEQTQGEGLILKLATSDGFEVAFALNKKLAGSLGLALIATSRSAEGARSVSIH
jgi:hypothetical protein